MRVIAGEFKGRTIRTGRGPGYRPATSRVREAVFSMLEARGVDWPRTRVLDLFAGSGSLGLEALSRGASFALFLENALEAAGLIARTAQDWGLDGSRYGVIFEDLLVVCRKRAKQPPFHLVFVDPPYGMGLVSKSLKLILSTGWVAPDALVCAEIEVHAQAETPPELELLTDRNYGQTRILLWRTT